MTFSQIRLNQNYQSNPVIKKHDPSSKQSTLQLNNKNQLVTSTQIMQS